MNQYTAVAGTTYSYDSDGNLAGDGVWAYGHDAQGRLVSATRPGTAISLGYDAVGRRRSRAVNGVATAFLSSGEQEVAEYDGAGALLRRFVWGPAGPDDIIAVIGVTGSVAARRRFHHADGLGSTVALTDSAGIVLERYAYTPFGVGESNTGSTPWRFTGRRLDAETGLYHLRARDYAPLVGRFVQPDPIGMAGGINLYAYVGNDPLNATDPSGLVGPAVLVPYLAGGALGALSGGYGGYLQGGWTGAAAGAFVGAAAGVAAPLAATGAGRLVGQGAGAVAARLGALTGVNFAGGVFGTYLAGVAGSNPASAEDMARGGAISALATWFTGEAFLVGAAVRGAGAAGAGNSLAGLYTNVASSFTGFADSRLRSGAAAPAPVPGVPSVPAALEASLANAPWNPRESGLYIGLAARK